MAVIQINPDTIKQAGNAIVDQGRIIEESEKKLNEAMNNITNLSKDDNMIASTNEMLMTLDKIKKMSSTIEQYGNLLIRIANEWQDEKNKRKEEAGAIQEETV